MPKTKLTKRQTDALKRHSKRHTQKHMAAMRKSMATGSTFTAAHQKAMKQVGR